ncbi:CsgG/HfaB family protein [Sphaerospermopsis aphanizomenoides BCCUSP55]|uniref:CsgG/HfaB family protein n=1 Tax=Sphaerospermopsis aphanizomenoides TaxID=459663 RepID=UPI000A9C1F23|nr:CsgG/HfaB family protein [Sphaerospermopsis aphanizomenoides]MBK1989373.1 CsgG/HfaB family protein [Sphaerospermopsis aphanizomenoides BCCUSP55]
MKTSSLYKRLSLNTALTLATITLGLSIGSLSAFAQQKPTISVPDFKNETSWWWWKSGTSQQLADVLSNELTSTGKFTVVERQKLGSVLSEQELAELGLVRNGTGAKKGELTGARYIILGKVTSYEEDVETQSSGIGGGFNIGPFSVGGGNRKNKEKAYLAIDLRVVDSTTGEVVHARTIEARATNESESNAGSVGISGLNIGGDNQRSSKAPVGKALRAGLMEITNYLSCVMVDKGSCIAEFEQKEQRRRNNTEKVLEFE